MGTRGSATLEMRPSCKLVSISSHSFHVVIEKFIFLWLCHLVTEM